MDFDDELDHDQEEIGSDELLSDDNLRLPASANTLVRLHAIRAWLTRRQKETTIEIGEAALTLQEAMQEEAFATRLRRREREAQEQQLQYTQQALSQAQVRLATYEEAEAMLEDCVAHTTSGERVLVEYYLMLDEMMQREADPSVNSSLPRLHALADVQHRIEHVGAPNEE